MRLRQKKKYLPPPNDSAFRQIARGAVFLSIEPLTQRGEW
jgi:hypothetical protein